MGLMQEAIGEQLALGLTEEMPPADYLSLIIEQRAAAAGIVLDAGV